MTDALEAAVGVFVAGTGEDGVARDSWADSVTVMATEERPFVRKTDGELSLLVSGIVMVKMVSELAAVAVANERALVSGWSSTLEP